jgi:DMSO reductase anchor subunit
MFSTLISFILLGLMYLNHQFISPKINHSFMSMLIVIILTLGIMFIWMAKEIYIYNIKTVSIKD